VDTGALSLDLKRRVSEPNHAPISSTGVKNAWSYTSTPPYVLMATFPFTIVSEMDIENISSYEAFTAVMFHLLGCNAV